MERLAKECTMRLYRTSVKEDLNVSGVFQHLAENYVNKVKSFTENNGLGGKNSSNGHSETFQIGASSRTTYVSGGGSTNSYMTNSNSRGPLYITKPPTNMSQSRNFNRNGYIPSVYSNNPTRPTSNPRVISTQNGLHGEW